MSSYGLESKAPQISVYQLSGEIKVNRQTALFSSVKDMQHKPEKENNVVESIVFQVNAVLLSI